MVVTDTMGRAWRNGQTDVAIGAAGLTVLHGYAGSQDRHGNELIVTEIAVADEIAAAADLVKGKLTDIPVAVVRGLSLRDNGSNARTLLRPGEDDLFWLGTEEAIALGRSQAQLLRRSVRRFNAEPVAPELIEAAVAEALTAPAPHHTRPVRFVWMQDPDGAAPLLDRMKEKWRADLTGDGRPADAVERRVGRGQILYDAPELVIPFMVPDGAHSYPDAERTAAEHTMFTVAVGAAVQALLVALAVRGVGSCWIGSTIFAADLVRDELGLPADWEPLGAIAIGYPRESPGRPDHAIRCRHRRPAGAQVSLHDVGRRGVDAIGRHPTPRRTRCATRCWRSWPRGPTAACARACRATSPVRRWCSTTPAPTRCSRCIRGSAGGCSSAGTARRPTPTSSPPRCGRRPRSRASTACTIDPDLAALHVHPVTCSLGVPTRHLDMQFIVHAPAGAEIACSDESLDLRWWPLDALPDDCDFGLTQLATAARAADSAPSRDVSAPQTSVE